MITRDKTLATFRKHFSRLEKDPMAWHYFKQFYELGWKDAEEAICNPFPTDPDPENKKWVEELNEMEKTKNKSENIQQFN